MIHFFEGYGTPRYWGNMTSLFVLFLLINFISHSISGSLPQDRLIKSIKHEADLDSIRVNSLLQCADLALSTWKPQSPDFFVSPSQAVGISKALAGVADLSCTFCGGYSLAERRRIVFSRQLEGDDGFGKQFEEETDKELVETLLTGVDIRGSFLFDKTQHSEFLEAVLTCPGISKEKVGDVITLGDKGCNVLLFPDQAATLCASLKSIRSVPVEVRVLNSLAELAVAQPSRKELSLVEASDRLDAVASAGFGTSRSAMVKLIESGEVFVNWKVSRASSSVHANDLVHIRGLGRLLVEEVALTAKGRTKIRCVRLT